jgi:small basic protein (TIGR04137 family)
MWTMTRLRQATPAGFPMTIHRSLKLKSALKRSRNVWTRIERLEALTRAGEWQPGKSVYGLRKVRTSAKVRKT